MNHRAIEDTEKSHTPESTDGFSSVFRAPCPLRLCGSFSVPTAYLLMLASAASFATMSACSHALAQRCDWRLVAVSRGGIAFALTAWLARARGIRVLFRWPKTLWMRSVVGSF